MDNISKKDLSDVIATELRNKGYNIEQISVYAGRKKNELPDFAMVFQASAYMASRYFSNSGARLLLYFIGIGGYANYLTISTGKIMEELKMSKSTVIRALKELESNNVIIKTPHPLDNRHNDYFINPLFSWKGKVKHRKNTKQKIDNNQISMFEGKISTDKDLNNYVKNAIESSNKIFNSLKRIG